MRLPDFVNPYCRLVTACAEVRGADMPKTPYCVGASHRTARGKGLICLLYHGKRGHRFAHVDVAAPEFVREAGRPHWLKRLTPLAQIMTALDALEGMKVTASISARYVIPARRLKASSLVRSAIDGVREGPEFMRYIGARMEIRLTGTQACRIEWQCLNRRQKVCVTVAGRVRTRVSETYLLDALSTLDEVLSFFVLGDIENAKKA